MTSTPISPLPEHKAYVQRVLVIAAASMSIASGVLVLLWWFALPWYDNWKIAAQIRQFEQRSYQLYNQQLQEYQQQQQLLLLQQQQQQSHNHHSHNHSHKHHHHKHPGGHQNSSSQINHSDNNTQIPDPGPPPVPTFPRPRKRRRIRQFRHDLTIALIVMDLIKAIVLITYPIHYLNNDIYRTHYHLPFCNAFGFLTTASIQASDFAVLALAIHTALLIF